MQAGEPSGPLHFRRADRSRALRFAALGNAAPIAVATATGFGSHGTLFFVGAIGACLAPIVVTAGSRRHPIAFYLAAFGGIPALTLMQAHTGGVASGYSVLMMMAMIWFGLQATDRELAAGVLVLAACSYLPMLIVGPPAYPVDWGHATLLVMIGVTVAGSLRAVTREMRRLTSRLRQEAVMDDLTGLLNRRGWGHVARRELARAARAGSPVGLMVMDLDRLKQVNDTMGHDEGDRLLRETADRLRAALRAADVVARLGGDEFVALLTDSPLDGVLAVVQRLRDVTPDIADFSAGVASWNGTEELDELIRRADMALYAAKASGGGTVELAPQDLEPAAVAVDA
jgi:diguanylate cyclase (GGDEF)-like protein